mgnify:CR=1 FL=1
MTVRSVLKVMVDIKFKEMADIEIKTIESTAVEATAKNNDVEPVKMEVKMNNNVEQTDNESRTTAANLFPIHRVELKGMNNYEAFDVVRRAVEKGKVLRMLVTPNIDRNGCPYYWMGLRYDRNEIVFKLMVNDEISSYIMACLRGDDEKPEVTTCVPDNVTENRDEWLIEHRLTMAGKAQTVKEELVSSNGRYFLNTKLGFKNGKVSFSEELDDVLSFLKPDEQVA